MLSLSNAKSLNDIWRDIPLVTLDIESLNHEEKEMAILHHKETIDLLPLQQGSLNKRVKQDPEKKINLDSKIMVRNTISPSHSIKKWFHLVPSAPQPSRLRLLTLT